MNNQKKLIILSSIIVGVLVVVLGFSYAAFTFDRSGTTQELVLGDIWMQYRETNGITLENVFPGDNYSKYFEFTITGKNTYEEKDIWYDIRIMKADAPEGKTEDNRIEDKYLKFKLVEVNDEVETEIFTDKTYNDLTNQIVHVATIPKSTNEYTKIYRLYMVISEKLKVGNVEGSISSEEFKNLFGSIKVATTGDFIEKEVPKELMTTALKTNVVSYATASSENFQGGLVSIGMDGFLYNPNERSGILREYRYSGASVNNYIYFNCKDTDGTYNYGNANYDYKNNCETWRIIGIFKETLEDETEEEYIKIVRNNILEEGIMPTKYYMINQDNEYTIAYSETTLGAYWNKPTLLKSKNYNDWTTSGLQFYLNTLEDDSDEKITGYLGVLSINSRNLIRETKYYLGNVVYGSNGDTAATAYKNERSETQIWNENFSMWKGKVALMYPSDYGYSVNSIYWNTAKLYDYNTIAPTKSWMQTEFNHNTFEWLFSPSNHANDNSISWHSTGRVGANNVYNYANGGGIRPTLCIKSNVKILKGDGTEELPYVVVAE